MRQRLADVYIEHTLLDLIRLRTLSARLKGQQPGPEASIRKILADEHGQHVMALARDLIGAAAMLTGGDDLQGFWWYDGFLFSQALTIGGGTGDVQRNIIGERVLGLPHDVDATSGQSWAETQRGNRV
jgi:alkylation response protein AidB-like acyl-CoA dehydrogenase